MHIRTFRAANLNSALAMIREQMGPEASILHTRQVAKGWVPWFQRSKIEVTAGLRHAAQSDLDRHASDLHDSSGKQTRSIDEPSAPENVASQPTTDDVQFYRGHQDVAEDWLLSPNRSPAVEVRDAPKFIGPLKLVPGHCLKIALVGGCGVGKTTTIAKLAAGFRLAGDVRVGLLTLDSIRAAAYDQIAAYANAMEVPLGVVRQQDDVPEAERLLSQCDVVFVDTPGYSSKSQRSIAALGNLLASLRIDQTHLVLDCNHSHQATNAYLDAFSSLQPTAVVLSKLDDVPEPYEVLSGVARRALGISYLTTGQRVPQDICVAEQEMLRSCVSGLAS